MLEFPILAVCVICIAGMIPIARGVAMKLNPRPTRERKKAVAKKDNRPVWERENGKREMEVWLTGFLKKLKRNSTRTQKCRLISSVERAKFEEDMYAVLWHCVRFGEDEAEIFYKNKRSLEKFKLTEFQKMILKSDSSLKNQLLCRSKINEESGKWDIPAELKTKIISEGGEALVFGESFGNLVTAVRVQIFDPFLFSKEIGFDSISWKIHFRKDFEKAVDKEEFGKQNQMPKHENVIENFVNIELFHKKDSKQEDCIGWITVMEKGGEDLRKILKEEKIGIEERKKIAEGISNGFLYLVKIGIMHFDLKMENILMVGGIPKIIDFGLVQETSGRSGYREMGYARRGSKFRNLNALFAATPGFANQRQFTVGVGYGVFNLFYFLLCDWKSSWTLLYAPIGENERKEIDKTVKKCNASSIHKLKEEDASIFSEITSIISISSSSSIFCLDDRNLTKSVAVSSLKQNATRFLNNDLQNVTQHVIDQKNSNLCVPISVATLLRFAMKKDLDFEDKRGEYSSEAILATLTLIVYPRSMAGLNLNPNEEETKFQSINQVELLLNRLCKNTYLMETGWQIIRQISFSPSSQPKKSTCKFEIAFLNENFIFTRPLTVTGAYLVPELYENGILYPAKMFFHQMVLDSIENEFDYNNAEYVIHNTSFAKDGPVLKIPKTRAYYVNEFMMRNNQTGPNEFKFYGPNPGDFMWLVNERVGNTMQPNTWYLLPTAYSITLVPETLIVSPLD